MPGFRKRTYPGVTNGRVFKKRRFNRARRKVNRVRKSADYTSNNQRGTSTGFRGKKVTRRAFRKQLWDSSTYKTHYRAINSISTAGTTLPSYVYGTLFGQNMYRFAGEAFWTANGGFITTDTGASIPGSINEVTLRGGLTELCISNTSAHDIKVRMFSIKSVAQPNFGVEPSGPSRLWDPSASADFSQVIGKPYETKEVLIESGNNWSISRRLRLQKIDLAIYGNQGYSPIVYLLISNMGHNNAATFRVTASYNLSFVAES